MKLLLTAELHLRSDHPERKDALEKIIPHTHQLNPWMGTDQYSHQPWQRRYVAAPNRRTARFGCS